jgi:type II secretory pathway component PulM
MICLRSKERALFFGLVTLAMGLGLYGFVVRPALARVQTLQRVIPERRQELHDLAAKTRQVLFLSSQLEEARRGIDSTPSAELLPSIESVVSRQGLQTHLTALSQQTTEGDIRQGQAVVEVALQKLSLAQVLDLFQEVQTAIPAVRISSLHLSRPPQDPGMLNVTATLRNAKILPESVQVQP